MALSDYIKSIKSNITKREKAIERSFKDIQRKKDLNKEMAARVKELEKLADGKSKPAKKIKAKKSKASGLKLVIKKSA